MLSIFPIIRSTYCTIRSSEFQLLRPSFISLSALLLLHSLNGVTPINLFHYPCRPLDCIGDGAPQLQEPASRRRTVPASGLREFRPRSAEERWRARSVHGLCCIATEAFFANDGAVSRLRCRPKVAQKVALHLWNAPTSPNPPAAESPQNRHSERILIQSPTEGIPMTNLAGIVQQLQKERDQAARVVERLDRKSTRL